MMSAKSCTHIKVPGVGCGCPALRGEQFCYFHQRMLRTVKDPASRVHHTALLEDEESIQASLMEVVNALLRGTIELKRAELILRALNTAVRNIRRVKFGLHRQEERAASAPSKKEDPLAEYFGGADKIPAHLRKPAPKTAVPASAAAPQVSPTNVGTAAPGCPDGPEVSGRSAVPQAPPRIPSAKVPDRQPPLGVKEAPKECKNAAHSLP